MSRYCECEDPNRKLYQINCLKCGKQVLSDDGRILFTNQKANKLLHVDQKSGEASDK